MLCSEFLVLWLICQQCSPGVLQGGPEPHLQMGNWGAERGLEPGLRPLLSGLRDCPGPTSTVILTAAFGRCPHVIAGVTKPWLLAPLEVCPCGLNPSVVPVPSLEWGHQDLGMRCRLTDRQGPRLSAHLACVPDPELQQRTYCVFLPSRQWSPA